MRSRRYGSVLSTYSQQLPQPCRAWSAPRGHLLGRSPSPDSRAFADVQGPPGESASGVNADWRQQKADITTGTADRGEGDRVGAGDTDQVCPAVIDCASQSSRSTLRPTTAFLILISIPIIRPVVFRSQCSRLRSLRIYACHERLLMSSLRVLATV
jgi:hypothetical protein